ncbi:hypothetical protein [Comamonas thiooxydans]|uniref:hypothetical protein n=1 Tax=Comamonas thiooxydans TaxID=363952 RepID=UPI001CCE2D9D|nr:hypothetical protein [Comamonas thiooxydans]UBQ41938.1 hypothetical protein LCH15_25090 [Comamonas thiooxydans]
MVLDFIQRKAAYGRNTRNQREFSVQGIGVRDGYQPRISIDICFISRQIVLFQGLAIQNRSGSGIFRFTVFREVDHRIKQIHGNAKEVFGRSVAGLRSTRTAWNISTHHVQEIRFVDFFNYGALLRSLAVDYHVPASYLGGSGFFRSYCDSDRNFLGRNNKVYKEIKCAILLS